MDTIEKQFEKFYENIKLTQAQRDDAKVKYTGVCEKLHDNYYPNITYSGNTKLLVGSYGKGTAIRPARDIDVIFIMPPEKFDQYNDNSSNKQSQLLQDIKKILETKYTATNIKADGKVVVVEFSETKHDVEVIPAWELPDGTFRFPNSTNGGSWETHDYRGEIKKIADSESSTGKTKFTIRSIKKWSGNCSAKLTSYQIEQVVLSFFTYSYVKSYTTPQLFANFFQYFHQNIADQDLRGYLNTAINRSKKALDFEKDSKFSEAVDEWRKIFGDDFPKTITKSIEVSEDEYTKLTKLHEQYPSTHEEYLTQKYGTSIEINPNYKVSIDADITKQDGFRDSTLLSFLARRLPVQKKKKLLFKVTHSVPSPYQIKWKVRNFGEEAKGLDALRGEIHDDEGRETRQESTLYYGEHYVECYIIKDGKCVALGRILVPIGNNY